MSVLDRQLVGTYETTTIASRDPQALQAWLRENGFVVSTNSEPVIADYVKEGWVFVAAKVRRDRAEEQTSTPHPLSFTFKTARPVYPMRLTGVDNGSLQVELYVFAGQRVYAPHFKVERCVRPRYPEPAGGYMWRTRDVINVMHPLLRSWVAGTPVATKLTATLTPEMMKQDVWLEAREFRETQNRHFSHRGAFIIALNWGAAVLLVGLVSAYLFTVLVRPGNPKFWAGVQLAFAISVLVGGMIYLFLPKIEVRLVQRLWEMRQNRLLTPLIVHGHTLEEARRLLGVKSNLVAVAKEWGVSASNHYLGGEIHEEDSPGNFILREKDGEVELVIYDAQAAERVEATWRPKLAE